MSKHDANALHHTCWQLDKIADSPIVSDACSVAATNAACLLREISVSLGDGSAPINWERLDATLSRIAGRTIGTHS
jgi:hypothetical protein